MDPSDLVFVDESGAGTRLVRTHGRAPRDALRDAMAAVTAENAQAWFQHVGYPL